MCNICGKGLSLTQRKSIAAVDAGPFGRFYSGDGWWSVAKLSKLSAQEWTQTGHTRHFQQIPVLSSNSSSKNDRHNFEDTRTSAQMIPAIN